MSREQGDPAKAKAHLPDSKKQYLITRNGDARSCCLALTPACLAPAPLHNSRTAIINWPRSCMLMLLKELLTKARVTLYCCGCCHTAMSCTEVLHRMYVSAGRIWSEYGQLVPMLLLLPPITLVQVVFTRNGSLMYVGMEFDVSIGRLWCIRRV